MKKQGPPEPLDEAHFTTLKRKAGMSVAESRAESQQYTKKRRTNGDSKPAKKEKSTNGKAKSFTNSMALPSHRSALKKSKKPEAVPLPLSDEEDEDSDAADLMDDEFDDLSGEEVGAGLEDDFLESGSDVYDSEDDHAHKAMFSEDEDESDAEEKLTAANIAGLTRKLDMEMAEQEAEAQAELEEAALQTNIAGDRPHILEGGRRQEQCFASARSTITADENQRYGASA
jgi:ribosomal RNA methyltransferase Nop2